VAKYIWSIFIASYMNYVENHTVKKKHSLLINVTSGGVSI